MAAMIKAGGQRIEVLLNAHTSLEGTYFSFQVVSKASGAGAKRAQIRADNREVATGPLRRRTSRFHC